MPRYFFNLINSVDRVDDEEGEELANVDAARDAAIAAIRSIVSDEAKQGRIDLRARIIVLLDGKPVLVVPFSDAIEISSGPPRSSGEQAGVLM